MSSDRASVVSVTITVKQLTLVTLFIPQMGVVSLFSGSVDTLSGCYSNELAFATTDNKRAMNTYIDDMVAGGATNYIEPLEKAFKLLRSDQPGNRREYWLKLCVDVIQL